MVAFMEMRDGINNSYFNESWCASLSFIYINLPRKILGNNHEYK